MPEYSRHFDYDTLFQPLQEVAPASWQKETFNGEVPEALRSLRRFSAGQIVVNGEFLDWTFLSNRSLVGESAHKYVRKEMGQVVVATLEKIVERMGRLGKTEELSFSLVNQPNPELGNIPAHGYSPTEFQVDQATKVVKEVSSGSIVLFPPALSRGPYLGVVDSVPHVAGIVGHEWSHQFMAGNIQGASNLTFSEIWDKYCPGWSILPDGRYSYNGAESPPTPYARINPTDDFADSLMLYILDPKRLAKTCPERYAFYTDLAQEFSKGAVVIA